MRIIAGKYRGRKLKSPPSLATRPTSDRLRETLFNVLAPRIGGARFLDLCAGTGAVGIEALSRGGSHVSFVDKSQKMGSLIKANLKSLEVENSSVDVVEGEALTFLRELAKGPGPSLSVGLVPRLAEPFDIIFFDPPYAADYEAVLNYVGEQATRFLKKGGLMIVEHEKRRELDDSFGGLQRFRILKQGDSCLSFYRGA